MKYFIMILIGLFLLADMSSSAPMDYEKMSEDIQTMSRLIDGELQKGFAGKYLWSFWNTGCMGFYLKGYGVVFTTRVQFPVFDYRQVKSEKETETGDLWEVYRKGTQHTGMVVDRMPGSDSMKNQVNEIKKLEKLLTEIICKYGGKLEQLSSDEYIIIALQGSGGRGILPPPIAVSHEDKEKSHAGRILLEYPWSGWGEGYDSNLVMRLKKRDLGINCADKIEKDFY